VAGVDYLHLCGPRTMRGPLSIAIAGLPERLAPGWRAEVLESVLAVGPVRVSFADAERAAVATASPAGRPHAVAVAIAAARSEVPSPPPAVVPGLTLLAAGEVAKATLALAGLGDGLTPAGDDVLMGYAGACAWAGCAICVSDTVVTRTSPLSVAYLRCAEHGELPEPAEALLRAVTEGDSAAAARRARRLADGWGGSSGVGFFWGLHAAWAAGAIRT
jgi:hypothetical protein